VAGASAGQGCRVICRAVGRQNCRTKRWLTRDVIPKLAFPRVNHAGPHTSKARLGPLNRTGAGGRSSGRGGPGRPRWGPLPRSRPGRQPRVCCAVGLARRTRGIDRTGARSATTSTMTKRAELARAPTSPPRHQGPPGPEPAARTLAAKRVRTPACAPRALPPPTRRSVPRRAAVAHFPSTLRVSRPVKALPGHRYPERNP
jgi:hypothetical protein